MSDIVPFAYEPGPLDIEPIANVRSAIQRVDSLVSALEVRSMAEAAKAFYHAQGMEEQAQAAKAVSLWAQRKAGEFIRDMPKNAGAAAGGEKDAPRGSYVELRDDTPTLADLDIDKHDSHRWQLFAQIPEEKFQEYIDDKLAQGYELTAGGLIKYAKAPHVSFNTGDNEWYTPPEYIKRARAVLGSIDLDPASSAAANKIVGASRFYTAEDDGLVQEWSGRVWMNPPYASDLIGKFIRKYAEHVAAGEVTEGIVLVNNATETNWFAELVGVSAAAVFPSGRVRFLDPQGNPGAPLQGQAVVYAGPNADKFLSNFASLGWGAKLWK